MSDNIQDNIQHGIDDDASGDAEKGAALGGLGGAAVGAVAGSLAGPLGTVIGAVAGGLIGAGASGAAVAAVDAVDNDNTVTGIGDGATRDLNSTYADTRDDICASSDAPIVDTGVGGHNVVTGSPATTEAGNTGLAAGALAGGLIGTAVGGPIGAVLGGTLGSLAGGVAGDASEASAEDFDTTAADANYSGSAYQASTAIGSDMGGSISPLPGDSPRSYSHASDDVLSPSNQTDYRSVDNGLTSVGATDQNADTAVLSGNKIPGVRNDDTPGIQTGGATTQGADTRGILEKTADALTGDDVDDKTGGRVLNDPLGTNPADTTALNQNSTTYNQSNDTGSTLR